MGLIEFIRSHAGSLPKLATFSLAMSLIVGIPALSRRVRLPAVVGLLLCGVLVGPHVLGLLGPKTPIADFFAELGKLLLMFFAGLEIDLVLFKQVRNRSIAFGLLTTAIPLLLGTGVGLWFGYRVVPAIVIGSLLASHTLLGLPIVTRLGVTRLEPVTIAVGATVLSDTLSLIVFAICVPIYKSGFSASTLGVQLLEIAIFVPFILFGLSRIWALVLKRVEHEENAYFVLMLGFVASAAVLADKINLPDIVGAFLAGLALNTVVRDNPAKKKLDFFGNALFIPIFFAVTGFLIDPQVFVRTMLNNIGLVLGVISALLVGKLIAAEIAGQTFRYTRAERMTVWSLTLPQVAATLAAALVAFNTLNAAGERLLDNRLLNVVLVLMLTTSILGPVLTEHFAPRISQSSSGRDVQAA